VTSRSFFFFSRGGGRTDVKRSEAPEKRLLGMSENRLCPDDVVCDDGGDRKAPSSGRAERAAPREARGDVDDRAFAAAGAEKVGGDAARGADNGTHCRLVDAPARQGGWAGNSQRRSRCVRADTRFVGRRLDRNVSGSDGDDAGGGLRHQQKKKKKKKKKHRDCFPSVALGGVLVFVFLVVSSRTPFFVFCGGRSGTGT